jgi:hypothetical protein
LDVFPEVNVMHAPKCSDRARRGSPARNAIVIAVQLPEMQEPTMVVTVRGTPEMLRRLATRLASG